VISLHAWGERKKKYNGIKAFVIELPSETLNKYSKLMLNKNYLVAKRNNKRKQLSVAKQ
jgi:hypothetical protein